MSNLTIEVKNDAMLGRLTERTLHIELIKKDKEIERLTENNQEMQEEMARTWKKNKRS